jgi:hypothetical protein
MASTIGTIFNLTMNRPTRTDASLIASPFFHLHLLSKTAQKPAMSSLLERFSYTLCLHSRKRDLRRGWVWTLPDSCVIVSNITI